MNSVNLAVNDKQMFVSHKTHWRKLLRMQCWKCKYISVFAFCSWNIFLALSYWSVDKIEKCLLTLWSDVLVSSWCRRIWQHFLIPQLAVCPSRHCWPGNWPSGSSLSIRPLTNAIKGLLQTLPLPTTTKSFRFSNYTKFCQMSNLIWCRQCDANTGGRVQAGK